METISYPRQMSLKAQYAKMSYPSKITIIAKLDIEIKETDESYQLSFIGNKTMYVIENPNSLNNIEEAFYWSKELVDNLYE